jgi:hypothetical protein
MVGNKINTKTSGGIIGPENQYQRPFLTTFQTEYLAEFKVIFDHALEAVGGSKISRDCSFNIHSTDVRPSDISD